MIADAETEFIDGLMETYPSLQYLDGYPNVWLHIYVECDYKCMRVPEDFSFKFLFCLNVGEGCVS